MAEPVEWQADGTPFNPRFNDVYRSQSGGLEQARHVFLQGCGLPDAWAGKPQWRILETGFGLGLNFLAAWQAWRVDPARPRMLHFASIEAWPASAQDLLRSAAPHPELMPLASELARQWHGLLPGFHRFSFEGGHVLLTLCVGDVKAMLRALRFQADAVFLDGFSPELNPDMWDIHALQSVARCCSRGTRLATWTSQGVVKQALRQCGFFIKRAEGLAPKRHRLVGTFEPGWEPKVRLPLTPARLPGRCAVVGAGLAGAAVAASLARRGWTVQVLDVLDSPAAGASGLPAGVIAPHVSPDDSVLSRLTRCGIRMTLADAAASLRQGEDWAPSGVLERRLDGSRGLAADWPEAGAWWSRPADAEALARAGLPGGTPALWHAQAGWIRPASLVGAWMAQPGVTFRGASAVTRIEHRDGTWQLLDAAGKELASADLVVIAAGPGSNALVRAAAPGYAMALQPIRGQVTWGLRGNAGVPVPDDALPESPVNGSGSFVPAIPTPGGPLWLMGATFERDVTDLTPGDAGHAANLQKLQSLLPDTAARLAPQFTAGTARAWTGIRCASADRLPLLGPLDDAHPQGVWLCTAMGSRGLTFAALCGELLAARLHAEPLPVELKLSQALSASRDAATAG